MLDYTLELLVRPIIAEREREATAISRAAAAAPPSRSRGLRASFASRLARLALALHREAAAETGPQPTVESSS
jgi:hypothetical protein